MGGIGFCVFWLIFDCGKEYIQQAKTKKALDMKQTEKALDAMVRRNGDQ